MKQKFLEIYEYCTRYYGGFAPDIPGACSVAKTLKVLRRRMKEVVEIQLKAIAEDGFKFPKPVTTSFDFGEIADKSVNHYVVEWFEVEVPVANLEKQVSTA